MYSSMFPFLQVFAMTDTVTSSLGGLGGASSGSSDLPDFPGEHPSDKDLCDWLDVVMPKLRRLYGALLRGETPQHLLQFENGADDLTGLVRIDPAANSASRRRSGTRRRESACRPDRTA